MMGYKEVADAFRKLSNDSLAVALAVESEDPMAIAMALIDYRFSSMDAAIKMRTLARDKIGEENA